MRCIVAVTLLAGCEPNVLPTIQLDIKVHLINAPDRPLGGVRACVESDAERPCSSTDESGRWSPNVPTDAEVVLSYELDGYQPTLVGITTSPGPFTIPRAGLQPMALLASVCNTPWTMVGVECPPTVQSLLFVKGVENRPDTEALLPPIISDVTVGVTPSAELGPIYETAAGIADLNATATYPGDGNAFFAGLQGDEVTITLSHPTRLYCHGYSFGSWAGRTANTTRAPVKPGFRTFIPITCE